MENKMKNMSRYKLFIFIGIELLVVLIVFLLIFFAGRKTYTVTFELNDGELLSGELVQYVRRGGTATPPNVARQGCYLLRWSGSYSKVTGNVTCTAVWEYETTPGIEYEMLGNSNYCIISGCYDDLSGDVYVGSYYQNKKVLGIKEGAFEGCKYIESLFFLDGIISIGDNAFKGCDALKSITLPDTTERIGNSAFEGCTALEEVTMPTALRQIGDYVFRDCVLLEEIDIPSGVKYMGAEVFDNPNLTINVYILEEECLANEYWNKSWVGRSKKIIYIDPDAEDLAKETE